MKARSLNNWKPILRMAMDNVSKEYGKGASGVCRVDAAVTMLTYQRMPDWLRKQHYLKVAKYKNNIKVK